MGSIYLIHFNSPLSHAKHYLGYTDGEVEERVRAHREGRGARILQVLNEKGIGYEVVRVWSGPEIDRGYERRLKNRGKTLTYCPICRGRALQHKAEVKRKWREKKRVQLITSSFPT